MLVPCKSVEDNHEPRDTRLPSRATPSLSLPFIYTICPHHPPSTIHQAPQSMAHNPENQHKLSYQVAQASTAITFAGSLSLLSGLTLTAAIIGLAAVTPLFVIFSPVLVPAAIAMLLLVIGFLTSGGLGTTAGLVFYWMYNYVTGKHPVGADKLDRLAAKLACGARNIKDRAAQSTQHLLNGTHDA